MPETKTISSSRDTSKEFFSKNEQSSKFRNGDDGTYAQGCQMVYFQTKNYNLGKFGRALDWKMLL
jgi:hypothetical protein